MADVTEELVIRLSADVQSLTSRMDQVASQVTADNNKIIESTKGISESLKTGLESVVGFWGAWKAEEAIHALTEANIHMQQIQYTLQYATGSAKGAAEQLQFLGQVSNSLGINLQEAGMQFARILAAAQGQQISISTLQSLYLGLAKTFDILHASTYSQQRVMNTFTEMITMGTVHTQQFQTMLGRDLPGENFIHKTAQELHLTDAAFVELLKHGQLTATEVIPAVAAALNKAADHGTALQSAINGTNATLNRFHTAMFEAEASISEKFAPAASAMGDQLTQIIHTMIPLDTQVHTTQSSFSGLREGVNDAAEGFLFIKGVVVGFAEILKAFVDTMVTGTVDGFYMIGYVVKTVADAFEALLQVVAQTSEGIGASLSAVG
ncbi:MAG: tape measure protein, partial [Ktedonobacteraceae bacterium]